MSREQVKILVAAVLSALAGALGGISMHPPAEVCPECPACVSAPVVVVPAVPVAPAPTE